MKFDIFLRDQKRPTKITARSSSGTHWVQIDTPPIDLVIFTETIEQAEKIATAIREAYGL